MKTAHIRLPGAEAQKQYIKQAQAGAGISAKPAKQDELRLARVADVAGQGEATDAYMVELNDEREAREARRREQELKEAEYERLMEQAEQAKNADWGGDDFVKALKIAGKIMNGEPVTAKDRQFLIEKFPELYRNAELLRTEPYKKPNKPLKSISEDEEESEVEQLFAKLGLEPGASSAGKVETKEVAGDSD